MESLHSVKILTAGLSSCSASSVLNMLSMFHSPKWVYDNSVLQRNLSKDRKRKRNRAHCSWKQRSSLWNWHLWNHEWKHSLLYWLDSSPLQPNPFKNLVNFTDTELTLDAGVTELFTTCSEHKFLQYRMNFSQHFLQGLNKTVTNQALLSTISLFKNSDMISVQVQESLLSLRGNLFHSR